MHVEHSGIVFFCKTRTPSAPRGSALDYRGEAPHCVAFDGTSNGPGLKRSSLGSLS